MELEGSIQAGVQAHSLLSYFRQERLPLVHIQHISSRPGATFFLPDTDGMRIYGDVQPLINEICFQKHYPNSFRETPLLACLQSQQINRLVICGMMTICASTPPRGLHMIWDLNVCLHRTPVQLNPNPSGPGHSCSIRSAILYGCAERNLCKGIEQRGN